MRQLCCVVCVSLLWILVGCSSEHSKTNSNRSVPTIDHLSHGYDSTGAVSSLRLSMLQLVGRALETWGSIHLEGRPLSTLNDFHGRLRHPSSIHSGLEFDKKSGLPLLSLISVNLENWGAQTSNHSGKRFEKRDAAVGTTAAGRPSVRMLSLEADKSDTLRQRTREKRKLVEAAFMMMLVGSVASFVFWRPKFTLQKGGCARDRSVNEALEEEKPASRPLPVVGTEWGWCIRGCYAYEALKVGLRQLSSRAYALEGEEARIGAHFLREQLMKDLCAGVVDLEDVHPGDLAAAHGDVAKLSLTDLMYICTKYGLPGNGPQGDFLRIVDNVLYDRLGYCAIRNLKLDNPSDKEDIRRIGHEAVLLVAAGAAIATPTFWNWWIGRRRVFFDVTTFSCREEFPQGGVLEFSDFSRLRFSMSDKFCGSNLDWQVHLVTNEKDLMPFKENQRQKTTYYEVSIEDLANVQRSIAANLRM